MLTSRESEVLRLSMGGLSELLGVVTLSEAARRWRLHRTTLMNAIDRGRLSARRSGRVWLLLDSELRQVYGLPIEQPQPDIFLRYRSTRRLSGG